MLLALFGIGTVITLSPSGAVYVSIEVRRNMNLAFTVVSNTLSLGVYALVAIPGIWSSEKWAVKSTKVLNGERPT